VNYSIEKNAKNMRWQSGDESQYNADASYRAVHGFWPVKFSNDRLGTSS